MTRHAVCRSLLVRGSALAIVLGAFLFPAACHSRADEPKPPAEGVAAAGPPSPTFREGERYDYALEMSTRLGMSAATAEIMNFRLRAELRVHARQVSKDSIELSMSLAKALFEPGDPAARPEFARIAEELQRPFAGIFTKGKLTEVRVRNGASRFGDAISRSIAASLQFSTAAPGGSTWTASESDASGEHDVEYREEAPGRISKRKLRYQPSKPMGLSVAGLSPRLTPEVLASKGEIHLGQGPAPLLERITTEEKLALPFVSNAKMYSENGFTLILRGSGKAEPAFDWQALVAETRATAPGEQTAQLSNRDAFDSTRIGDYTFETALRELEANARDPKTKALMRAFEGVPIQEATLRDREQTVRDQGRVFAAMTAILRTQPATVGTATRHVRSGSLATTALLDAMASAGTPETQRALATLMEDGTVSRSLQSASAYALIRVERATPETVTVLSRHVAGGPLRVHALYGLGTIARRLREAGQADRAADIVALLVQTLAAAETPTLRVHVLRGIANSGQPSALDAVRPHLRSDVDKVRAAAVDATRLMQHPDVDALIAERLATDEEPVQLSALDALTVRPLTDALARALGQAAEKAVKGTVRLKAVRVIEQVLPTRPDFRPVLERIAEQSEFDNVKDAAARALEP